MTRENAQDKGSRYLLDHRLVIDVVDGDIVHATCRGSGQIYELGHKGNRWWCSCPARGVCSHLVALQAVTAPPSTPSTRRSR